MKDITACFTGHRSIPADQHSIIRKRLTETIISLIHQGYSRFCAGGALGFDTLAAQAVLMLKHQYPNIRLILMLACPSQARNWNEHDQAVYEDIKAHADEIIYTAQAHYKWCMHKRNRILVDSSSFCICYLVRTTGGTAYTVKYAQTQGIEVTNIAQNVERRQ